ncbi:MAG TPA: aldose 1-epimerase [Rectinemataceae bacterium]|nr:aldose 1-epimerase [Rectinemataceae bacterium]
MFRITRTNIGPFSAYRLSSGQGDELLVLQLGGTVRDLALCPGGGGPGRRLLSRCGSADIAEDPLFRGRLLFPFNDRIPGGRYVFEGVEHRLRINSAEDGSAIHGFLYRRTMECLGEEAGAESARLVLRDRIRPGEEPGYPFALSLRVEYELGRGRAALSFVVRNEGKGRAPFALGWHPYFDLASGAEELVLEHGGERYVPVDASLMPLGALEDTAGGPYDFRSGRRLGRRNLDLALTAPPDGRLLLSRPGGAAIELHADRELFPFTQLFVPPERDSLAVEPISSPTNAFNRSELGLQVLAPGEERRGRITLERKR